MEPWPREADLESLPVRSAVLLHGFGDSPECWSPMLAAIDADLDVATPAAPGHARERMPPGAQLNLDLLAAVAIDHLRAAVDRAGGPVVLGGHSRGAMTAAALAGSHPDLVAALYLEDPAWGWPPADGPDPAAAAQTAELAEWIHGLQSSSHEDRVQWCLDHNPGWPADEYDIWARAKSEVDPAALQRPVDLGRLHWPGIVAAIRCPTTLLVGEPARGSACAPEVVRHLRGISTWRVIQVPGAGHDVRRCSRATAIDALLLTLQDAAEGASG